MAYRIAHSLDVLRDQINQLAPKRSKVSDGWIGDAKHKSRSSDHNPWIDITENGGRIGIVTALDITHDPANGIDSERLAEALIASRDPRIKYIISNRKIVGGSQGVKPWMWRAYSGSNPHNKHVHISVEDERKLFDSREPWKLALTPVDPSLPIPRPKEKPLIKRGSKGGSVRHLQTLLNTRHGEKLIVDGDFGPATDKAVRLFQRAHGLVADGKVGPYTWEKLEP